MWGVCGDEETQELYFLVGFAVNLKLLLKNSLKKKMQFQLFLFHRMDSLFLHLL